MRILRASDHKRMPWKNGAGETVEIAVFPEGASVEDFDWRVSMASVVTDGAFSLFPGVDRTLSILEGEGLSLSVEGRETVTLRVDSAPHSFPADRPTTARLSAGAVTDLNVMTRRWRFSHRVTRHVGCKFDVRAKNSDVIVLGLASLSLEPSHGLVQPLDAIVLEPGEHAVLVGADGTTFFTIEVEEAMPSK